jgi:hypothetical protein
MKTLQTKPQSTNRQTISHQTTGAAKGATHHCPAFHRSGDWVKLSQLPSEYSHDEALLLCEIGGGEWITWVPGFGEFQIQL